jgi:hypothetical protein
MFASPCTLFVLCCTNSLRRVIKVYHFLLDAWPFFATLTIASYVLIFFTTVVSILCRLHFGLGLTEHRKNLLHSIPNPY